MTSPLRSLIESGTKLWLDSIDPELVKEHYALGATGATSNPIIVSDLIKSGRFDDQIAALINQEIDDESIAWQMTDAMVRAAQDIFLPVWQRTGGNDGYVSFELDPLLEDVELGPPHLQRVRRYIELGRKWSAGHSNRMIKVPATPAGLDALEELAATGTTLNVTLIFSNRQYEMARENIWRGALRRTAGLDDFKSVYSIFISRVDVYTGKHMPELSDAAQGLVGIVNSFGQKLVALRTCDRCLRAHGWWHTFTFAQGAFQLLFSASGFLTVMFHMQMGQDSPGLNGSARRCVIKRCG